MFYVGYLAELCRMSRDWCEWRAVLVTLHSFLWGDNPDLIIHTLFVWNTIPRAGINIRGHKKSLSVRSIISTTAIISDIFSALKNNAGDNDALREEIRLKHFSWRKYYFRNFYTNIVRCRSSQLPRLVTGEHEHQEEISVTSTEHSYIVLHTSS